MCDTFYSTESRVWSKSRAEGVEPVSEHEQNYIGTMSTEYHHYLFCTTSHFTCIDACLDRRVRLEGISDMDAKPYS